MFRGLGSLALLLAAIGPVSAQNVPAEEAKEGFVSMFNGKDFTGWRFDASSAVPEKLPANWKVEDGVIKLTGGGKPHCGSQWDYEDFDLRLEWRAMRANYNSGLYIRSGRNVGANQINLAKGGEGGFIGGKIKGAKTVPTLQKPFMEWNHWRVLAVGDKVTFWCNDQLAWEGTELKDLRGYVGLQAEGAPIEFRNLRIKELGYDSLSDLKSWAGAEARWKKEADGTLVAGAGAPVATNRKDFKDFAVRLEWQADKGTVAALQLRGDAKAAVSFGDVAGGSGVLAAAKGKPAKAADVPLGQWNYLDVRLVGDKATVWLNGTVVARAIELKGLPAAGSIALLVQGGPLRLRNIRVKEIKN